MRARTYLDWNASAPLRPEARAAMLAAMDAVGNPSSVHAEGRAAWTIVERARAQVARLVGCEPDRVVFTSGATEANAMAAGLYGVATTEAEHPSLTAYRNEGAGWPVTVDKDGRADYGAVAEVDFAAAAAIRMRCNAMAVGVANGETGVVADLEAARECARRCAMVLHHDAAQAIGRVGFELQGGLDASAAVSAHKLGGPTGVGAYVAPERAQPAKTSHGAGPMGVRGGGQERGWRAGTQNVAGIAGFGAAAEAARRDFESGVWDRVARLRNILDERLVAAAPDATIVARGAPRLPNTTCVAVPGWRAEMQVMQLDLAGFAVSAGAACSSGKVGPSRVLKAMGYDDEAASSAVRVSLGWTTTEDEIARFAETWTALYRRRRLAA